MLFPKARMGMAFHLYFLFSVCPGPFGVNIGWPVDFLYLSWLNHFYLICTELVCSYNKVV
jgi:hypothetical protein